MPNGICYFHKIATPWSSEVNKTILEQIKLAEWDCDYMLEFFKKEKLYTKNLFQEQQNKDTNSTSKVIGIISTIFSNIYLESSAKVFSIT